MKRRAEGWSRREFLGLTLVGTAGLLGLKPEPVAAEPPPETTMLRLLRNPGDLCAAPQYVAEPLLRDEGFTEVQYVRIEGTAGIEKALTSGEADIGMNYAANVIMRVDAGDPVVILAGGHVGCLELFGTERVQALRDLKGKTVAVFGLGSVLHVFLSSMLAYVGLDPNKDVNWDTHPPTEAMQLLAQGKIDALMGGPPVSQELRAKHIGHVVVNSTVDRPWSHYFCCMVIANREFVQRHPVATKRMLRAIMKAADVCAREPERAARLLVDRSVTKNYDYALQALKEIPYGRWREYDPEDTLRFHALRLHEVGMIKSSPQKIIAEGTDWRFLNEIKKELKG
jgi:NitT/TauT family transport system substrate-binding protein